MSLSASDEVRITTGMCLSSASSLISDRIWRPSFFGRLRSSRITSGLIIAECFPRPLSMFMASTPSTATEISRLGLLFSRVSRVRATSPGLSSTRSTRILLIDQYLRALRHGEVEGRTLLRLRCKPDPATMTFDDLLGDGKPDPAAVIASPLVQALEHLEHAVAILLVDADAIVGNREHPAAIPTDRVETHPRRTLRPEFQGIADQILEQ